MNTTDTYRLLFGRSGTSKGSDIDMSEQGRVGGVSTGTPFKTVGILDVPPTDSTKNNSSTVLSYNANGDTVKIVQTIGATNYTTNITPQNGDTAIVTTKTISAWT